ncbi:hypothetical protein, partial [Roseomonas chloroacetimidivorans]|uniref:hypothetical protein n=1 Tax=Roseomonas chloroacetimidivorans TaxID=1766656 RepID=UPI003C765AC7
PAGAAPQNRCQRILDRLRLTQGDNSGIAHLGVSLLREVQAGFHPPRYAASLTSPSPTFGDSSSEQREALKVSLLRGYLMNIAMFCSEAHRLPEALRPHMPEIRAAEKLSIQHFGSVENFRGYIASRTKQQIEELSRIGPRACPAALSIFDRLPSEPGPGALAAFAGRPDIFASLQQGTHPLCPPEQEQRVHPSG